MPEVVNVDNFARAESNLMFSRLLADGTLGAWTHYRHLSPLDQQPIIRQNRDTLYSAAIVDVAHGATLTIPPIVPPRYLSVMVVNQDHYIPEIFHDAGTYALSADHLGTRYVMLGARILVDPADADDVAEVNALQDQLGLSSDSDEPFIVPDYDEASHVATRTSLIELSRGIADFRGAFGRQDEVSPVRHLLGCASGWGGLPSHEAHYLNVDPQLPVGDYSLNMADVPVDAFWSISVYNAEGYFEPNPFGLNNLNSVTAIPDPNGSTTVWFGSEPKGRKNFLPIMEGWNFLVRLYRPRPEAVNGGWRLPELSAQ